MFVNFSNHPVQNWSEKQKESAAEYGDIVDLPFPAVPAAANESEIEMLAENSVRNIMEIIGMDQQSAVMVQGEFTLTYAVVNKLLSRGIKTVSACADRMVSETEDDEGNMIKHVGFHFERFREYR